MWSMEAAADTQVLNATGAIEAETLRKWPSDTNGRCRRISNVWYNALAEVSQN